MPDPLPIPLRRLGDTSLAATRLGLGLAALGRPGYVNLGHAEDLEHDYSVGAMQDRADTVLDAAWQAGIRYFDTARSYGRGEEFLGSWLTARHITPEAAVVGSKWGYTYTANWHVEAEHHEIKDHSLIVLQRQIGESRAILGAHLDLYQIHSATLDSGVLERSDVFIELARRRDEGLAIGLSLSGPQQAAALRRALEIEIDGRRLFSTVQASWNLLEPSVGSALADAHAAGMGVIVKEALANGRLTARNQDPSFAPARTLLEQIATDHRTTIDALALAAVLAQPWADVVLSGAATVEHLQSNVAALSIALDESTVSSWQPIAESPSEYWSKRSRLPWN